MNLEDLNKTQIILLTILVSFVSAIATSIFTVKLLEEAPQAVTQTINRVVERTVERVVPAEPSGSGSVEQTVIEKETTVVVKEEDLITDSIEKNKRKIVRLVTIIPGEEPAASTGTGTPEVAPSYAFHGIGVIVRTDGLVVTSSQLTDIEDLVALTPDGAAHPITVVEIDERIAILQVEPVGEGDIVSLSPVTFADGNSLRLGQTVIALGGENRTSVSIGIIASLIDGEVTSGETTTTKLTTVHTNISGSILGSPLVNIFGEFVGIDLSGTPGVYTASTLIRDALTPLQSAVNETPLETAGEIVESVEG